MQIDLQALAQETIDFTWIDGKELHVFQPTVRFVNRVERMDNTLENCKLMVLEFVNERNKEGRKFTLEEVAELNSAQLQAVLLAVLGFAQKVDSNPN